MQQNPGCERSPNLLLLIGLPLCQFPSWTLAVRWTGPRRRGSRLGSAGEGREGGGGAEGKMNFHLSGPRGPAYLFSQANMSVDQGWSRLEWVRQIGRRSRPSKLRPGAGAGRGMGGRLRGRGGKAARSRTGCGEARRSPRFLGRARKAEPG